VALTGMLLNFQYVISTPVPSMNCKGQIKADIDKLQQYSSSQMMGIYFALRRWFGCQVTALSKVDNKKNESKRYDFKKVPVAAGI